jgi:hypothetical protein
VAVAGKSREAGRDHRRFLDRRTVALFEVAEQPSCGHARVPVRLLPRDQHGQVERVGQVERRLLLRRRLGDE